MNPPALGSPVTPQRVSRKLMRWWRWRRKRKGMVTTAGAALRADEDVRVAVRVGARGLLP